MGFKLTVKRVDARKFAVRTRKDALIVMLEKFTSTAIVKTEAEGRKKNGKKGKKGKKKAAVQSWKKQSKGTRVNLEAVLFSIEQLRSSYIELSESVQYLIGICYLLRVRYLDQQRRARQAQAVTLFTSKKAALASVNAAKKKHDEPIGSESAIPYLHTLGMAGSFTFFMHVNAPLEIERKKKSLLAFEQDKRRAEQISLKESKKAAAKKNNKVRVGPRFQIFAEGSRPGTAVAEGDDEDKEEETQEAWKEGATEKNEKEEKDEEEDDDEDEDDDEEEEEEEESSEEEQKEEKKGRERTRFLVPKRDTQRKYESTFVEDLLNDTAAVK